MCVRLAFLQITDYCHWDSSWLVISSSAKTTREFPDYAATAAIQIHSISLFIDAIKPQILTVSQSTQKIWILVLLLWRMSYSWSPLKAKHEVNKYNLLPEIVEAQKSIIGRKQRIKPLLRSWFFWDISQCRLVDSNRSFGTIYQSTNHGLLDPSWVRSSSLFLHSDPNIV
jgi:hypothetical protein